MLDSQARHQMASLGITASVQPAFITSEVDWLSARVGDRAKDTYALGEMEQAGIRFWAAPIARSSRRIRGQRWRRLFLQVSAPTPPIGSTARRSPWVTLPT